MTDMLGHYTDVLLTGTLQMFAVGRNSDNGITVDQSGAVLGKWSPPHVVSDHCYHWLPTGHHALYST